MEIGRLGHRITIERETQVKKGQDCFARREYQALHSIWAGAKPLYGAERKSTTSAGFEDAVEFTVRCSAYAQPKRSDRILFRKNYYNIEYIEEPFFNKKYLKIRAVLEVK